MISVDWYPIADKICAHFRKNVFVPSVGPDFAEWLQAETGGRIVYDEACYGAEDTVIEFALDQDYTLFLLKWS